MNAAPTFLTSENTVNIQKRLHFPSSAGGSVFCKHAVRLVSDWTQLTTMLSSTKFSLPLNLVIRSSGKTGSENFVEEVLICTVLSVFSPLQYSFLIYCHHYRARPSPQLVVSFCIIPSLPASFRQSSISQSPSYSPPFMPVHLHRHMLSITFTF